MGFFFHPAGKLQHLTVKPNLAYVLGVSAGRLEAMFRLHREYTARRNNDMIDVETIGLNIVEHPSTTSYHAFQALGGGQFSI